MVLVNDGSLGELGGHDPSRIKAEVTKEILNNLFSDDSSKIIQNTDFKRHELPSIFGLEIINHVLIKRFCFDKFLRDNFQNLINRTYQARVSIDRQGRKELGEMLKQESMGLNLDLGRPPEAVK